MKKRNFVLRGFNAFTLAEVLITLVIIGVIGALTVPALIQNTQKQEFVSALKKAYSVLSQNVQQINAEEGLPMESCWSCKTEDFGGIFTKRLNVTKICGLAKNTGCMGAERYYHVTSPKNGVYFDPEHYEWIYKFVTADGMSIALQPSSNCSSEDQVCLMILIDVNGKKGPNLFGRDLFLFKVFGDGALDAGGRNSKTDDAAPCGSTGSYGCGLKVLTEGAMNY